MSTFTTLQQMILAPYEVALAAAGLVEAFLPWNQQIFPDKFETINAEIVDLPLEDARNVIRRELLSLFQFEENSNPWNLNEFLSRTVDEQGNTVISVGVHNGPNDFYHPLTEEQTRGLSVGLFGEQGWSLSINGIPFDTTLFSVTLGPNYLDLGDDVKIYFTSPTFMQGFVTAALWTARDVNSLHQGVYRVNDDGSATPLTMQI